MRVLPSLISGIFSVIVVSLLFSALLPTHNASAAYSPDVNGARAYANSWCPALNYPEDKIADYMWVTAPNGSNQISANIGVNQVNITINFFATYCKVWPRGFTNCATNLRVLSGGVDKLIGGPGSVTYGPKTTFAGTRSEWGTGQYGAQLNIAGWGTGWHNVCTQFLTTTTRGGAIMSPSPFACFDLYLTRVSTWSTISDSMVGVNRTPPDNATTSANVGQTLYWKHRIGNTGPDATDRPINYAIGKSGFSAGSWLNGAAPGNIDPQGATNLNNGAWFTVGWSRATNTQYTVRQVDVGKKLCEWISRWPTSSSNAGGTESVHSCIDVLYNYNLIPSVTGPNGTTTAGSTIPNVQPQVNNRVAGNPGATTTSPAAVEWQLRRVDVAPGKTIPMTQQENGIDPCTHYKSGGATVCLDKGTGTRVFPPGLTPLTALTNEPIGANTPVGTKICFTLSVRPYSQANGNWRHGVPACVTVSKQPKVQIWGGDLRTRGDITTSTTAFGAAQFGSWVEYAAFSTGSNASGYNFASGSGFASGTNTSLAQHNLLTFANTAGSYGNYTLPTMPGVAAQFTGAAPVVAPARLPIIATSLSLSNSLSGTYKLTSNNVTITASDLNGKSIVLIAPANGTVTITGDINYKSPSGSDTFNDPSELPQLIIIAKNINIKSTAKTVNAWLLTTNGGAINTCSDVAPTANLDNTICKDALTINGPVMTDTLYLRRTAGSDGLATADVPGETFNLRADTYLWASVMTAQSGRVQTDQLTEAAARF